MRLKAYFTLESSVIVPMFIMIFLLFVMITLDMHDEIVIRSVDAQVAMKYEQEMNDGDSIKQEGEVLSTAVANIEKQCVMDVNNSEQAVKKRVDDKELITENRPPDFVRIISAGLKLTEK